MKKKTAILTARLTPAEKAAIERRAKQANMTVTDYIVKSALSKNVRQTDELAPILSELKAQGRNLNQLTKLANMGRITLVDAENFTEAYTNLYGLIEEIYWEGGVTVATFIAIRNTSRPAGLWQEPWAMSPKIYVYLLGLKKRLHGMTDLTGSISEKWGRGIFFFCLSSYTGLPKGRVILLRCASKQAKTKLAPVRRFVAGQVTG